jgi:hypothetical protein
MKIPDACYKIISDTDINSGNIRENLDTVRNSVLCQYNTKNYIISVCHNIYKNTNNYILLKQERIKINNSAILCIPEIDIMIIDVTDILYFNDKYKIDIAKINYNVDNINNETQLFVIDPLNQIQITNIEYMRLCKFNMLYPQLLKYYGTRPELNLAGYSGSPIFDKDNNIIAMTNGYSDELNYISSTPFFFIKRILMELDQFGIFCGLCGFYQHYIINNKSSTYITKKEEIDHNIYIGSNKKYNYTKLLPEDKILEIDNIPIDITGNIYCHLIGISIDISSYINLTKTINDITTFKVYREKNKIYKNITVVMGNRDYNSSLSTSININYLESIWSNNRLYMKINSSLWDYIKRFKSIEENTYLSEIFQMKFTNKQEINYLLIEDKILNINIFKNPVSNYMVVKDIY